MKLGTRIFVCCFLIFAACFYYPIDWIRDNIRIRYLEGVEDPLVDQANLLAEMAGTEMAQGTFNPEKWYTLFANTANRPLSVNIYKLTKKNVDIRVYITDKAGILIFDSAGRENIGLDYSIWRDVYLTLNGQYGARSTLQDPTDPKSSVLYVAAPIRVNGELAGSLTVAKPTANINEFLINARPQITKIGALAILAALLLSFLVSIWLTRPIQRLTQYAEDISRGKRVAFPVLDDSEIGDMGKSFEKMQEALEGKNYVEQYVQNLTHEIKSPLSAIRGAAELLQENMQPEQRQRFLANIHNESNRIQEIVDRMLELAAIETRRKISERENISVCSMIKTVLESKRPILSQKKVTPSFNIEDSIFVKGDSFLLNQAIANLIQNAIDFSPELSSINIDCQSDGKIIRLAISDNGPGIPDYAKDKIYDKFFSLPRPNTGKKSTGLGLNFVKEVAELHFGSIKLENKKKGGVKATLTLPV
ncbi:MAG: two-component system sensor histidine kinase CreC [Desulfobacteraceae bacterium]|jgi:two-component system sensor histidine kinase CreC|nr:two-component system sensor histidine kinase CreC [Desulfobacteraceae bacterium]